VLFCSKVKVIAENTGFVICSPVNKNGYKNGKKSVKKDQINIIKNNLVCG